MIVSNDPLNAMIRFGVSLFGLAMHHHQYNSKHFIIQRNLLFAAFRMNATLTCYAQKTVDTEYYAVRAPKKKKLFRSHHLDILAQFANEAMIRVFIYILLCVGACQWKCFALLFQYFQYFYCNSTITAFVLPNGCERVDRVFVAMHSSRFTRRALRSFCYRNKLS